MPAVTAAPSDTLLDTVRKTRFTLSEVVDARATRASVAEIHSHHAGRAFCVTVGLEASLGVELLCTVPAYMQLQLRKVVAYFLKNFLASRLDIGDAFQVEEQRYVAEVVEVDPEHACIPLLNALLEDRPELRRIIEISMCGDDYEDACYLVTRCGATPIPAMSYRVLDRQARRRNEPDAAEANGAVVPTWYASLAGFRSIDTRGVLSSPDIRRVELYTRDLTTDESPYADVFGSLEAYQELAVVGYGACNKLVYTVRGTYLALELDPFVFESLEPHDLDWLDMVFEQSQGAVMPAATLRSNWTAPRHQAGDSLFAPSAHLLRITGVHMDDVPKRAQTMAEAVRTCQRAASQLLARTQLSLSTMEVRDLGGDAMLGAVAENHPKYSWQRDVLSQIGARSTPPSQRGMAEVWSLPPVAA